MLLVPLILFMDIILENNSKTQILCKYMHCNSRYNTEKLDKPISFFNGTSYYKAPCRNCDDDYKDSGNMENAYDIMLLENHKF